MMDASTLAVLSITRQPPKSCASQSLPRVERTDMMSEPTISFIRTWRLLKALVLVTLLAVPQAEAQTNRIHWAYQPLASTVIPSTRNTNWSRSPVDAFILAKLESNALQPA